MGRVVERLGTLQSLERGSKMKNIIDRKREKRKEEEVRRNGEARQTTEEMIIITPKHQLKRIL